MKILIVNDQFESGGAARVAALMCNGLSLRGHIIHVIAHFDNHSEHYALSEKIVCHNVDFSTHGKGNINRTLSLMRTAKDIRPIIKTIRPEIIIAVQANAYIRAFIANRFTRIPLIAADHTSFSRKMDVINTFTRHYLYRYADGISILTKRDELILGQKYPQKKVIYNPLSYPLLEYKTERKKTVLCAGRFDIWYLKGFDIIVDIWSHVCKKYPEWKLQFAGTGKDENINRIKQMVDDRGIKSNVEFLGQIDDMQRLYAETGIFALPSRTEGFPMVLLEAMSQGCPCVAFNVGGASAEMIEHRSGFVIEDGCIDGFEMALESLICDETLCDELSANSIESVKRFSLVKFLDSWESLISESSKRQ